MSILKSLDFLGLAAPRKRKPAARITDCDTWFPVKKPRGVVLLTHGLNLNPARMDELGAALAAEGFEVFRPAFAGHCGHNKNYLNVSAEEWERDAREFHAAGKKRAEELGVPFHLVAYSFSAAIYQSFAGELDFASRVYLAPALSTKSWYPIAAFVANAFPWITYRSMNLKGYYANATSGARAVQALEYYVAKVRARRRLDDPTPTLVLVDPADELVSYKGLSIIAGRRKHWRLKELSNSESTMRPAYHHLVVTEEALGPKEWKRLVEGIAAFLGKH